MSVVESEILTDSHDIIKEFITCVHTCRQAVEFTVLDDTVILQISQRKEIITFLRAVAHRQIIILHNTRACHSIKPISVRGTHGAFAVNEFR